MVFCDGDSGYLVSISTGIFSLRFFSFFSFSYWLISFFWPKHIDIRPIRSESTRVGAESVQVSANPEIKKKKKTQTQHRRVGSRIELWCGTLPAASVLPRVKGTYYKQSFSIYYKPRKRRSIYVKLEYQLLHFCIHIINNS